ncbi:RNA polymerase sigma factor [Planctomycetota bacterium]
MSEQRFEALVEQYSRQVLNTAYRVLGCSATAQDVHQEVFLVIWRRWHKFNEQVNWPGYLYRTTVRKALQYSKEVKKTSAVNDFQENPAGRDKPDEALRTNELQQKLAVSLSKLPARQAEVFVLSRLEGLSHAEIARMLDCSPETVRVHLHRAMKRLAQLMKDYLE